jgi:hypothetical protein
MGRTSNTLIGLGAVALASALILPSVRPWNWREAEPGRVVSIDNGRDRNPITIAVKNEQGEEELRLSNYVLGDLEEDGIPRDVALAYNLIGMSASHPTADIRFLFEHGVTPEIDSSYAPRFRSDSREIVTLHERGITPEMASQFATRYDADEIISFKDMGLDAETANAYDERYDNHYGGDRSIVQMIELFHTRGIGPEEANRYLSKFSLDIDDLVISRISPDLALAYDGFTPRDIISLQREGIGPEDANKYVELNRRYGSKIDTEDIIFFSNEGMPYEDVASQAKRNALERSVGEWNTNQNK